MTSDAGHGNSLAVVLVRGTKLVNVPVLEAGAEQRVNRLAGGSGDGDDWAILHALYQQLSNVVI